ncbi:MAG TPA: HAD family hydrolase [Candidatus Dormibacteraeota bacterium]
MPLRAALVDVGGTLWPDGGTIAPPPVETAARLAAALPGEDPALLERLRAALEQAVTAYSGELVQDTDELVGRVAAGLGLHLDGAGALAVRRAMNVPADHLVRMFADAPELLRALRGLGLRTVIVSNAYWRDAEAYRRDFETFGVGGLIDGVVSSVDLGRRKPDPAMHLAGAAAAGCDPRDCVMIGNVEEKDVLPALTLGMRALRVSPGAERAPRSAAGATVTGLVEAAEVVRRWAADSGG